MDEKDLSHIQEEFMKYSLARKIVRVSELLTELNDKFETLGENDTKEKMNIIIESQHLFETLVRYTIMLEEVEKVANKS